MNADDERFWRYSEMISRAPAQSVGTPEPEDIFSRRDRYRVTSYFWILESYQIEQNPSRPRSALTGVPQSQWLYRLQTVKSLSTAEMITDAVMKQNGSYAEIRGGLYDGWGETNSSNHLDRQGHVSGANVIFADGHSAWRPLEALRYPDGTDRVRAALHDNDGLIEGIW
jgi:prepilin-type processing-associated H-X9-DG protein